MQPLTPLTPRPQARPLAYLLLLTRIIARGRVTARDAAAELGLSYRTVYRMLRSLEAVGLRVESQREGLLAAPSQRVAPLVRLGAADGGSHLPNTIDIGEAAVDR